MFCRMLVTRHSELLLEELDKNKERKKIKKTVRIQKI